MSSDALDDSQELGKGGLLHSHEKRLNMHAQRLRSLEDFRLLHQQTEKAMQQALEGINKHLAKQDSSLDAIEKKMSKWGGMITVIIAIPAAIITVVELMKLLKIQ